MIENTGKKEGERKRKRQRKEAREGERKEVGREGEEISK